MPKNYFACTVYVQETGIVVVLVDICFNNIVTKRSDKTVSSKIKITLIQPYNNLLQSHIQ